MRIPALSHTLALMPIGLAAALAFASPARATGTAQIQYQADVQRCHTTSGIDQQACLKEAGAALEAARRNALTAPSPQAESANLTDRCDSLKGKQQQECLMLMSGAGVTTEGSVSSGGILREATITIPANAAGTAKP